MATKKRGIKKWIFLAVVLILVGLFVYARMNIPVTQGYKDEISKKGDITTYYNFSGNVSAKNSQIVMSEAPMQIKSMKVQDGDKVKKDEVLFTTTTGEKVKAKIKGEVTNLDVKEDEAIGPGVKLMDIIDYDNLRINVKVDEYDLVVMKKDKECTVTINALDKEIKGTISKVSKAATTVNDVTYFTADIDIKKDSDIKIGMSAEVEMVNKSVKDVTLIPMKALAFNDDNTSYVYKLDADDKMNKVTLEVGINDGEFIEITGGLAADDVIYYKDNVTQTSAMFAGGGGGQNGGGSFGNGE